MEGWASAVEKAAGWVRGLWGEPRSLVQGVSSLRFLLEIQIFGNVS